MHDIRPLSSILLLEIKKWMNEWIDWNNVLMEFSWNWSLNFTSSSVREKDIDE